MNLQGSSLETTRYGCISEVHWIKHTHRSHIGLGRSEYGRNKDVFTAQMETDP